MPNQKPKISIVTACFNSEKSIANTIESVLAQTYQNIEYIVIDGASSDQTISIIKGYEAKFKQKQIEFHWKSEKDTGIYNAWNKGLKIANGDWISFVGADDVLLDNAIESLVNKVIDFPESDFISAKAKIIYQNGTHRIFGEKWNWNTFKKEMKILHAGGLHNKDYFQKYGVFDDSYKITGDYELLLRAKSTLKVEYVNEIIIEMGGEGVSSSKIEAAFKEAKRAKIETVKRNSLIAYIEMYWVLTKIKLKSIFS